MAAISFTNGLNTAADRTYLAPGELIVATGCYYKPGDTQRLWKILGRTSYGDAYAGSHAGAGVAYFAFDTANADKLVVANDNGEYHFSTVSATDATSGDFVTLTTGLTSGAKSLAWTHFDDIWFFCDDVNKPFVLKSDGTFRAMGLGPPVGTLQATAGNGTLLSRCTTATYTGTEWGLPTFMYDAPPDVSSNDSLVDYFAALLQSFGGSSMNPSDLSVGSERRIIFSGWSADTGSDRAFYTIVGVNVSIGQIETGLWQQLGTANYTNLDDAPSGTKYDLTLYIDVSYNNGGDWEEKLSYPFKSLDVSAPSGAPVMMGFILDDGEDLADVEVRFRLVNNGNPNDLTYNYFMVFDTQITDRGWTGPVSTQVGMYYAVAEAIPDEGIEGPLSPPVFVTMSEQNQVKVTFPAPTGGSAPTNPAATHWYVYRTFDGGTPKAAYRRRGVVDIAETVWIDPLDTPLSDESGIRPPLYSVGDLHYEQNYPPPRFKAIVEYQNFLVAIDAASPRSLAYSYPNRPEYWPAQYRITDFPLKEHDKLVNLAVAGDLLIVAAEANIIVVNGLPDATGVDTLINAEPTVLRGAPGCVGPYAMAEYSLHGEPRVVWVSEHGVYETNGHSVQELSTQLDWANTVSQGNLSRTWLHWDRDDQIMEMGVDTDGDGLPDRVYFFHMTGEHRKGGDRGMPKITGPHYGSLTNKVSALANDGRYRIYSLDTDTSGAVYHEKDGGTDAGDFFNTVSEVPMIAQTGRLHGPDLREWAVDFPTVRHTSWGATPLLITWDIGRDDFDVTPETDSVLATLTVTTQKATKFAIARSGEWHQVKLTHNGDASAGGGIGVIQFGETIMGETGDTAES